MLEFALGSHLDRLINILLIIQPERLWAEHYCGSDHFIVEAIGTYFHRGTLHEFGFVRLSATCGDVFVRRVILAKPLFAPYGSDSAWRVTSPAVCWRVTFASRDVFMRRLFARQLSAARKVNLLPRVLLARSNLIIYFVFSSSKILFINLFNARFSHLCRLFFEEVYTKKNIIPTVSS